MNQYRDVSQMSSFAVYQVFLSKKPLSLGGLEAPRSLPLRRGIARGPAQGRLLQTGTLELLTWLTSIGTMIQEALLSISAQ